MAQVNWFGPAVTAQIRGHVARNLTAAGVELLSSIRDQIDTPGPPRSAPGKPPHIDTGALIVSYDVMPAPAELAVYVGSDSPYVIPLEFGTDAMAARPHLVRGFLAGIKPAVRAMVQ